MSEAGVEGFDNVIGDPWFGVFAPAGTPAPIVQRIHEALVKALESSEVKERIRAQSLDLLKLSPSSFAALIRSDYEKWGKAVKIAGAKVN